MMLTIRQAAKRAGCSHTFLRDLCRRGIVPFEQLRGSRNGAVGWYLHPDTIYKVREEIREARYRKYHREKIEPLERPEPLSIRCDPGVDCAVRCGWRFLGAAGLAGTLASSLMQEEQ